jgi:glycosyltransferase involved in cell wall biosynthesis
MTAAVVDAAVPTAMIYHNITPGHFFARYRPELAQKLDTGRAQLQTLNGAFAHALGDSQFNVDELAANGFGALDVLPICMDFTRFDVEPDADVAARLADGRTNILFVGRFAPNKAHAELLRVLAFLRDAGSDVRLILAGRYDGNEAYFDELQTQAAELGVLDDVIFTGLISDGALLAYYRGSHLYLSLSDHEGFCVPLIEAMWFELPVIAYGATASGETLGYAGLVLDDKRDLEALAALVRIVLADAELRERIVASQRRRREDFSLAASLAVFDRVVDGLVSRQGR